MCTECAVCVCERERVVCVCRVCVREREWCVCVSVCARARQHSRLDNFTDLLGD